MILILPKQGVQHLSPLQQTPSSVSPKPQDGLHVLPAAQTAVSERKSCLIH